MSTSKKSTDASPGKQLNLSQELKIKLLKEGWTSIRQFKIVTGLPYTLETVRRVFTDGACKKVSSITLAIIMKHLNFSPEDMKAVLKRHLNQDDPLLQLIGDKTGVKYNNSENTLIKIYRVIADKNPKLLNILADSLEVMQKASGVTEVMSADALRR